MEFEDKREGLEEYAIVLDYLPSGKSYSVHSEPITQLLGEQRFTLLEAALKPNVSVKAEERVYIGKGEREKISLIKTRLSYNEITESAKKELPIAITNAIKSNEAKFVEIFNSAGPLNIREHSLELLPGIGKKYLKTILDAREEKKFESFADISARVPMLQDPVKILMERVLVELKEGNRFYLLTKPYIKKQF
jgi:putative nucleotide binding protein